MKGILKTKSTKKINCEVCGETIKREKSFKINTDEKSIEESKLKLVEMATDWTLTKKQRHCHICWSIVKNTL